MTSVPLATASVIYHKFFRENSLQQYDPYVRKISLTLFQNYFISSVLGINNMFNLTSKLRHSEIIVLKNITQLGQQSMYFKFYFDIFIACLCLS